MLKSGFWVFIESFMTYRKLWEAQGCGRTSSGTCGGPERVTERTCSSPVPDFLRLTQVPGLILLQDLVDPGSVMGDSGEDSRRLCIYIYIGCNALGYPSTQEGASRVSLWVGREAGREGKKEGERERIGGEPGNSPLLYMGPSLESHIKIHTRAPHGVSRSSAPSSFPGVHPTPTTLLLLCAADWDAWSEIVLGHGRSDTFSFLTPAIPNLGIG